LEPVAPVQSPSVELVGGIAAFNEEGSVARAIRSLLEQDLPAHAQWTRLWVLVSGSTDRTREVVEALAAEDPRIGLMYEPTRRGKSAALAALFARVQGDYLVLLDGDSVAGSGAVQSLLEQVQPSSIPFAVMGRPLAPADHDGPLRYELELLYELHHRFHAWTLHAGNGTHLADNLLLLPIRHLPPLMSGVVNDGAFAGAWLTRNGGRLLYAPEAHVRVEVPTRYSDHLAQRRRIHCGHRQVGQLLGVSPTTLQAFAALHPREVSRLIWAAIRQQPRGLRAFLMLGGLEVMAWVLSLWDRLPPPRDHTLWVTIGDAPSLPERTGGPIARISPRRAPSDRAG
jgi:hypothetical protein